MRFVLSRLTDTHTLNAEKPWFVEWFDEHYRMLYRHRNSEEAKEQVRLIIATLKPSQTNTILDLGCGEGRYTSILRRNGYRVLGLDLSETLVRFGKKREPDLDLVVGDMRTIPGHFDIILSLFTSFGYFESDEENERALQSVYGSLEPGGVYWLDFLNSLYVEKHLVPETVSTLSCDIEVLEKRKVEDGRIIKNIHFRRTNLTSNDNLKNGDKFYKESVRLFSRGHLEQMFGNTGFRLIHRFGDYRGNPWKPDSERTILVGRKET
ncbi:MAG: class I SAM-dependent methyltransferase [bacterium]|nr:class I SAM-dependent methyltransferase [bacterium]